MCSKCWRDTGGAIEGAGFVNMSISRQHPKTGAADVSERLNAISGGVFIRHISGVTCPNKDWQAMIEQLGHFEFEVSCDGCGETFTVDSEWFQDAVNEAKRRGWKIFKEAGGWTHQCPDCRDEYEGD